MNKVTADQIKAFLILSKETKMELMMRRARYHGTDLDIPETEQRRIEKLERQLLFYDALMALMTQGERMLIKKHVVEQHTWTTVIHLFEEKWHYQPSQRTLQTRVKGALSKLAAVCNQRLDFDFILEGEDMKAQHNDE